MFKFIKEIIASAKEGIAEAQQELAEEKQQENAATDASQKALAALPHGEKFGTALGAPFRSVIFSDWFTLFKAREAETEHYHPIHLYTFGAYPGMREKQAELAAKLDTDFGITDRDSCLAVVAAFARLLDLEFSVLSPSDTAAAPVDIPFAELPELERSAVLVAILSHVTTASTDVGYLEKAQSLGFLTELVAYITPRFERWSAYGEAFLAGQSRVGLNNALGTKFSRKQVGYLNSKPGSPWNTVAWAVGGK